MKNIYISQVLNVPYSQGFYQSVSWLHSPYKQGLIFVVYLIFKILFIAAPSIQIGIRIHRFQLNYLGKISNSFI